MSAFIQIKYLFADMQRITNKRKWRWYGIWFMPNFYAIVSYRLSRCCYLMFGKGWQIIHLLLNPLFFLLRPWSSRCEIHYQADIGPGLTILHSSLGIVVSGKTVAGKNLTLIGGNCIGMRSRDGQIYIGDNVTLGIAANILGPVTVGNNVIIGMSSLVINDVADGETVVGIPAEPIQRK